MAARLTHPIYEPYRRWLDRIEGWPSHAALSEWAAEAGVVTASGRPVLFVPPTPAARAYELRVHETGEVPTRAENWHDLFNALAWLAFPRLKAALNALHAAEIPREHGGRGRLRDMLTIFDEGGAIVLCGDPALEELIRGHRWRKLFWDSRARVLAALRLLVAGHAVLEQARDPWPGITCKAIFVAAGTDPDEAAASWLHAHALGGTPRLLASLPVFGYPEWLPQTREAAFYDDQRFFRPLGTGEKRPAVR